MNRVIGLLAVAVVVGACSDDLSGPDGPAVPDLSPALVSAPALASPTMPAVLGTLAPVYVSMPPGTNPEATGVTIRNGSDGPSVSTPMIDGGFDPVPILAVAGDSLVILVSGPNGVAESYAKVPARSRPVVVRTAPRHRRIDVPLNSIIRIVFNEPMDSASMVAAVRIRRGETDVPGTVTGMAVNGDILAATFEPVAPLDPETGYTIAISDAARSRQGTPLAEPVLAEFTTGLGSTEGSTLTVIASTTGSELDQDGYDLLVGGATQREGHVGTNGSFTLEDIAPGLYWVALQGISRNCGEEGLNVNSQQVTVEAGQSATVSFAFTCVPVGTATLAVTTSTSGADPDPDGYRFTLNDGAEQAIGPNATVTIPNVADTSLLYVQLRGMSGNCRHVEPAHFWWWGEMTTGGVTTASFTIECDAATFSASGLVAFASPTASGSAIWVSNADGTGRVQLTNGEAYDALPAWSPDGQRLAFTRAQDLTANIYVMNADGSNQVKWTSSGWGIEPDWSPDGQWIAFSGSGGVYVTTADQTDRGYLRRVGMHNFWSASPTWSPDGARLAFIGMAEGTTRHELYIMNADGSGLRKVNPGPSITGDLDSPAWSPDGSAIAVVAGDLVVLVNEDGSGARVVAEGWEPAWSPDGNGIGFSARACHPCVRFVGVDGGASSGAVENGSGPAWRP